MTDMQQGLLIAGIGIGLVFIVIIFLWGLMALMMRLTSGKQNDETEDTLPETTDAPLMPELEAVEGQRKAAAAAVAVASALAQVRRRRLSAASPSGGEHTGGMNPWLAAHRAHQIEQKNSRG
jgi:Na+-transporting methylmalonyl-CoA/oxaloacetate decarboxylase gamma subunit